MARGSTLAKTLLVPASTAVEVRAVPPTGDCFYDCLDLLLPPPDSPRARTSPRNNDGGFGRSRPYVRKPTLRTPQDMRNFVADSMTQRLFELYGMYAEAGVEDYAWFGHHHAPANLEELRAFARRVGKDSGAGHCLWADEYAIRALSDEAEVTLLIIDEQATSRGTARGARRRRNGSASAAAAAAEEVRPDGRFLAIGGYEDCVMLLRSRRQHYDAVILDGRLMFRIEELPEPTRGLWPNLNGPCLAPASATAPAASLTPSLTPADDDDEDRTSGKENGKRDGKRKKDGESENGGRRKGADRRESSSARSSSKSRKKPRKKR